MIFKRKKYPLPKFPDDVIPTFRELCEEIPEEAVEQFIPQIKDILHQFLELSASHPRLDMYAAEKLCRVAEDLLRGYPKLGGAHKALVIGAVRYFADADDALSETAFASGFDDDIRVMNHVLEELGREDLYIK